MIGPQSPKDPLYGTIGGCRSIGEATNPGPVVPMVDTPGVFVSAKKFAGSRPNMAFKLGPHGLGYYADAPPQLSLEQLLFPAAAGPPLRLELDEFILSRAPTLGGVSARVAPCRGAPRHVRTGPLQCARLAQAIGKPADPNDQFRPIPPCP